MDKEFGQESIKIHTMENGGWVILMVMEFISGWMEIDMKGNFIIVWNMAKERNI